jgi:large subunit ribosomal protein L6
MSRIGRLPVLLPSGVEVTQSGDELKVKGPKGNLSARLPSMISVEVGDGEIRFLRPDERKQTRAYHGLARALAANMVKGVTEGFSKELAIEGVGYRVELKGKSLNLSLGFSHPVEVPIPQGIEIKVEGTNQIRVEGIDREQVGQFAAELRGIRPPEPYKGKGVRYAGERIRRKVGKAAAGSAG